jgi:protein required for attachment to host cells
MRNQKIWVVVSNSALAKIFRIEKFPKIAIVDTLEHPESRLHNVDLVSERPGRAFDKVGVGRHAYSPVTEPKQVEVEKFAKDLAKYLDAAFLKKEFSRFYLIASPSFLGLLRKEMHGQTQEAIIAEIPKDMTDHVTQEIEQQIAGL